MRFARVMPSASTVRTCIGSFSPFAWAFSAGIRLSRIMVVLPDPETPVTAVRRPRGSFTSRACTVWMGSVAMRIVPFSKRRSRGVRFRVRTGSSSVMKPAILDPGVPATSSTVPWAMTLPPSFPASGPISIIWSARFSTRTSWSTSTTEFPSAIRLSTTSIKPSMLDGCRPMLGSSST